MRNYIEKVGAARYGAADLPSESRAYSRYAKELLGFLGKHRVALATHIQRQFPELFGTERGARMHLQTLAARGHVQVLRNGTVGRPNIYFLTGCGLRAYAHLLCKSATRSEGGRRPATSHLAHELLVTETAVSVTEAIRKRADLDVLWDDRFGFCEEPAFRSVVPDYGFLFRHRKGRLVCLVEATSGEDSSTRLQRKLWRYTEWSESPEAARFLVELYRTHGASAPRAQFRLLFVVENRRGSDEARVRKIVEKCLGLPRKMRQRVWVASVADLAEASHIDGAVWIRCADLEPMLTKWPVVPQRKRATELSSVIRDMRRNTLFPSE